MPWWKLCRAAPGADGVPGSRALARPRVVELVLRAVVVIMHGASSTRVYFLSFLFLRRSRPYPRALLAIRPRLEYSKPEVTVSRERSSLEARTFTDRVGLMGIARRALITRRAPSLAPAARVS